MRRTLEPSKSFHEASEVPSTDFNPVITEPPFQPPDGTVTSHLPFLQPLLASDLPSASLTSPQPELAARPQHGNPTHLPAGQRAWHAGLAQASVVHLRDPSRPACHPKRLKHQERVTALGATTLPSPQTSLPPRFPQLSLPGTPPP